MSSIAADERAARHAQGRVAVSSTAIPLTVSSIGHLAPPAEFSCFVHSVFANSCNFTFDGALLTLVVPRAGNGPTTLLLEHEPTRDLRTLFVTGTQLHCRKRVLRSERVLIQLGAAQTWQPLERSGLLPRREIERRLHIAAQQLTQLRKTRASVIDRSAADLVASIAEACRVLDKDRVVRLVASLVGLGEGLTPAGDDFLVGLLAGLDGLALDAAKRHFVDAIGLTLARLAHRTTDVAAHYLRLAARGHYSEVLDCLRDALLCRHRCDLVEKALQGALDVGATSGADMVTGLLAGLTAWLQDETNLAQT